MGKKPGTRHVALAVALLALAFHVLHGQLGVGGHSLDDFADDWVYDGVILGGAAACLLRALRMRENRLAWLVLGCGLAADAGGEIYYTLAFGNSGTPPIPSLADLLYLLYYPAAYVALIRLMRSRLHQLTASTWLDGGIAAATAAALLGAFAFDRILHGATHHESPWSVATLLAYPVGDLILLGTVFCMFALSGWRPGRSWLLLGAGLAVSAVADTSYVYANATGTYMVGGWLDSMWVLSAILTGASAWQSPATDRTARESGYDDRLLVIPGVLAFLCLGLLVYGGVHHVGLLGLGLAATALLLVILRAGWTFRENRKLLARSRIEALTDALTGLGNRRSLTATLDAVLADERAAPSVLVMFDLNGFKLYNDSFGHLAGDTLLAHLGRRLAAAATGVGTAFRLGGDEFCLLLRCDATEADIHLAAAISALEANGERFSVSAAYGRVILPAQATTATQALRIADDRMYAQKSRRPQSARQQTQDVLLGLLREREPDLHVHLEAVGQLAVAVGRELGLSEEELDELRRAAALHDIGKAAVPDAILSKPGPLSPAELEFMRRHTLVGERILAAAPALSPVAPLVRSSHEWWNGGGYPDGLSGGAIPLGARIVGVCDAFDAMTTDRPYARARSMSEACAELERCAGTQFDPRVVEAFVATWQTWDQVPAVAGKVPA